MMSFRDLRYPKFPRRDNVVGVKALDKRKPGSLKDSLSLIFSMIALGLSAYSFYFTNIYVNDKMEFSIVNTFIDTSSTKLENGRIGLIVINSGNREGTISNIECQFKRPEDTTNVSVNSYDDTSKSLPLILQPHEMKHFKCYISASHLLDYNGSQGVDKFKYLCILKFTSIDSKGQRHYHTSMPLVEITCGRKRGVTFVDTVSKSTQFIDDLYKDN